MPRSTDEIIKLRIAWLVIFVLVMATLAPLFMFYGDHGDTNRAERAEMVYNLVFLLVGYLIGTNTAPDSDKPAGG